MTIAERIQLLRDTAQAIRQDAANRSAAGPPATELEMMENDFLFEEEAQTLERMADELEQG